MYLYRTFQPPSSSKQEVCNKPNLIGGTTGAKILDCRVFKNLKNAFSRTFCFPKLSLGSSILHCLCKNFPKYLPDIILWTSLIVYLIQQHFSWFKNYKLYWFLLASGTSFASAKTRSASVDTAHDEDGNQEQLILFLVAKIFISSLLKVWSTWKIHKYQTFTPGSPQEETGGRELSSENVRLSLR